MAKRVLSVEFGVWWSKVALMESGKKNPNVFEVFYFQTPEHAVEDGMIRDKDALAIQLKTELSSRRIRESNVVFCINSSKVITREVRVPFMKDSQIPRLIQTQSKEFFPMDVTGYTIVFNHMGDPTIDPKKEMKLQLVAVPDNLLSNYVNFAQENEFDISSFEYMGHAIPTFLNTVYGEKSVVVQLEEQTTVISVLEGKKLVFQRVAPYGYGTSLTAVLEHPVLGAKDEHQAFAFLLSHDVLHDDFTLDEFRAMQRREAEEEEQRRQQEQEAQMQEYVAPAPNFGAQGYGQDSYEQPAESYEEEPRRRRRRTPEDEELRRLLIDAQNDIREALTYHLRVVSSALEYYKAQTKEEFHGTLHMLGDGVRFGGVKEMFLFELSLDRARDNYFQTIHFSKTAAKQAKALDPEGCIFVLQAPMTTLKIIPKELSAKSSKQNALYISKVIFAGAALISVGLVLFGLVQKMQATSKQTELKQKMDSLNYIQGIYDEHAKSQEVAQAFTLFAVSTVTPNELFPDLLQELEEKLPSSVTIQNIAVNEGVITIAATSDAKLTTAKLIMQLEQISMLSNISIPAMTLGEDAAGNPVWAFSVSAFYTASLEADNTETAEGGTAEAASNTETASDTESTEPAE